MSREASVAQYQRERDDREMEEQQGKCAVCSQPFGLMRRAKECAMCALRVCHSCRGYRQSLVKGGKEEKVCERCRHRALLSVEEGDVVDVLLMVYRPLVVKGESVEQESSIKAQTRAPLIVNISKRLGFQKTGLRSRLVFTNVESSED